MPKDVKTERRKEYCDSKKPCRGICVAIKGKREPKVVRCKHYIAKEYDLFGMTFDATGLEVG